MSTTATTTKTPFTVVDFAGRTLAVKSRKDAAIKYATAQDAEYITGPTGKVVWTNPNAAVSQKVEVIRLAETGPVTVTVQDTDDDYADEMAAADQANTDAEMAAEAAAVAKRTHKPSPKQLKRPWIGEAGGRFYFETYGPDAPTAHAQAPYSILRARLGVTWLELEHLGLMNQPAAKAMLAKMDAGKAPKTLDRDIAKVRKAIAEDRAARKAARRASK